jgi:hypothetical protein
VPAGPQSGRDRYPRPMIFAFSDYSVITIRNKGFSGTVGSRSLRRYSPASTASAATEHPALFDCRSVNSWHVAFDRGSREGSRENKPDGLVLLGLTGVR